MEEKKPKRVLVISIQLEAKTKRILVISIQLEEEKTKCSCNFYSIGRKNTKRVSVISIQLEEKNKIKNLHNELTQGDRSIPWQITLKY